MDLVDIDKVLDDFELNEDRQDATSCRNTTIAAAAINVTAVVAEEQEVVSLSHQAQNIIKPPNVTNVFHSLNEYVNAEVNKKNCEPVEVNIELSDDEPTVEEIVDNNETEVIQQQQVVAGDELSVTIFSMESFVPTSADAIGPPPNLIESSVSSSLLFLPNEDEDLSTTSDMLSIESTPRSTAALTAHPDPPLTPLELDDDERPVASRTIAFESTMDDVSDTELESYLQDLELEQGESSTLHGLCPDSAVVNDRVCDSISLASTVEFVDQPNDFYENVAVEDDRIIDGVAGGIQEKEDIDDGQHYEKPLLLEEPQQQELKEQSVYKDDDDNMNQYPDQTPSEQAPPPPPSPEPKNQPEVLHTDPPSTSSSSSDNNSELEANLSNEVVAASSSSTTLGQVQPYWIPDAVTNSCMQCANRFSLIKRRHHCRCCGQVLCSACCSMKTRLFYSGPEPVRICLTCHVQLNETTAATASSPSSNDEPSQQQPTPIITVVVGPTDSTAPPGVLKRRGASAGETTTGNRKQVMFSDGIRPGCDLTDLDNNWAPSSASPQKLPIVNAALLPLSPILSCEQQPQRKRKFPALNPMTGSYIPSVNGALPPVQLSDGRYSEVDNDLALLARLHRETLRFAIKPNFYIDVRIVHLSCCINKTVMYFSTDGMLHVGQDEILLILEMSKTIDDESGVTSRGVPVDIFVHFDKIFMDADKGERIDELGFSLVDPVGNIAGGGIGGNPPPLMGHKEHGGFLFIRPSFQCLLDIAVPQQPFLIAVLIHRWEVPWARVFPLRLMLRLGALYRYYPCPHVSVPERDAVYAEIAQTIINFLADFRAYTYTLATIRGMHIHMEDRTTSVLIPRNRYSQVMKALANSSEHILALGASFSPAADGHLVCIQNTERSEGIAAEEQLLSYSTQAVNIQGRPRKVTGASFLVLNGALKSSSGLSGKCSIVEDGLMVQILPAKMVAVQKALREQTDCKIVCGPQDGDRTQTEIVMLRWTDNDADFNIGVHSPIDNRSMAGVTSIRVHRSANFSNSNHIIRWTEVFVLRSGGCDDDDNANDGGGGATSSTRDSVDISKLAEQIARSAAMALVSYLDLLSASKFRRIGLRTTLALENVCYEAGALNQRLGPLYMNALDNELIPQLHRQSTQLQLHQPIEIELIFHILDE